jgi:hypothetical protein
LAAFGGLAVLSLAAFVDRAVLSLAAFTGFASTASVICRGRVFSLSLRNWLQAVLHIFHF